MELEAIANAAARAAANEDERWTIYQALSVASEKKTPKWRKERDKGKITADPALRRMKIGAHGEATVLQEMKIAFGSDWHYFTNYWGRDGENDGVLVGQTGSSQLRSRPSQMHSLPVMATTGSST
ncbi:MAG: hypothetical protein IPG34_16595 [Rhodocyclaceae bacterium]|nr:hypothetical protein [Rhodocyclaceae bacterium]